MEPGFIHEFLGDGWSQQPSPIPSTSPLRLPYLPPWIQIDHNFGLRGPLSLKFWQQMRKIQLYKKGFNVKNAVFDLKLALYLNSALHIFEPTWMKYLQIFVNIYEYL